MTFYELGDKCFETDLISPSCLKVAEVDDRHAYE